MSGVKDIGDYKAKIVQGQDKELIFAGSGTWDLSSTELSASSSSAFGSAVPGRIYRMPYTSGDMAYAMGKNIVWHDGGKRANAGANDSLEQNLTAVPYSVNRFIMTCFHQNPGKVLPDGVDFEDMFTASNNGSFDFCNVTMGNSHQNRQPSSHQYSSTDQNGNVTNLTTAGWTYDLSFPMPLDPRPSSIAGSLIRWNYTDDRNVIEILVSGLYRITLRATYGVASFPALTTVDYALSSNEGDRMFYLKRTDGQRVFAAQVVNENIAAQSLGKDSAKLNGDGYVWLDKGERLTMGYRQDTGTADITYFDFLLNFELVHIPTANPTDNGAPVFSFFST